MIQCEYEAVVDEKGEGVLAFAVYATIPCGCRVVGNGTLQHPLTIKHCEEHAKAVIQKPQYTNGRRH